MTDDRIELAGAELVVLRALVARHEVYETARRLGISERVLLRALAGLRISRTATTAIRGQVRVAPPIPPRADR